MSPRAAIVLSLSSLSIVACTTNYYATTIEGAPDARPRADASAEDAAGEVRASADDGADAGPADDAGTGPDALAIPDVYASPDTWTPAAPEASPPTDSSPGGNVCPIPPNAFFWLTCAGGYEFHVDDPNCQPDGATACALVPCGDVMPNCPKGWSCMGADMYGNEKAAVCP